MMVFWSSVVIFVYSLPRPAAVNAMLTWSEFGDYSGRLRVQQVQHLQQQQRQQSIVALSNLPETKSTSHTNSRQDGPRTNVFRKRQPPIRINNKKKFDEQKHRIMEDEHSVIVSNVGMLRDLEEFINEDDFLLGFDLSLSLSFSIAPTLINSHPPSAGSIDSGSPTPSQTEPLAPPSVPPTDETTSISTVLATWTSSLINTNEPSGLPTDVTTSLITGAPTLTTSLIPTNEPSWIVTAATTSHPTVASTSTAPSLTANKHSELPTFATAGIQSAFPTSTTSLFASVAPTGLPTDETTVTSIPTATSTSTASSIPTAGISRMPTGATTNRPTIVSTMATSPIATDKPSKLPADVTTSFPTFVSSLSMSSTAPNEPTEVPTDVTTTASSLPTLIATDTPTSDSAINKDSILFVFTCDELNSVMNEARIDMIQNSKDSIVFGDGGAIPVELTVGYVAESSGNSTGEFVSELEFELLLTSIMAALGSSGNGCQNSNEELRNLLNIAPLGSTQLLATTNVFDPCQPKMEQSETCWSLETSLNFYVTATHLNIMPDEAAFAGYQAIEGGMTDNTFVNQGNIPTIVWLEYLSPLPLVAPPQLLENGLPGNTASNGGSDNGISPSNTPPLLLDSRNNQALKVSPWTLGACVATMVASLISFVVWSRNRRRRLRFGHMELIETESTAQQQRRIRPEVVYRM